MQDIIKQWPILILLPMCTTDAGLSIITLVELVGWLLKSGGNHHHLLQALSVSGNILDLFSTGRNGFIAE